MKILHAIMAYLAEILTPSNLLGNGKSSIRDFFVAEYKHDAQAAHDYFLQTGKTHYDV